MSKAPSKNAKRASKPREARHVIRKRSASSEPTLFTCLGSLPTHQKALFLERAQQWLEWRASAERVRAQRWRPTDEHYAALREVARTANALHVALFRIQDVGIPEWYFREAWSMAVGISGVTDEPFPFPNRLPNTLHHVGVAAQLWLPDPKPRHRPVSDHSAGEEVVRLIAAEFHGAFQKLPAIGDGSPFVKFCRAALPRYGFRVPSTTKMRAVLAVFKSASTSQLKP